MFDFCTHTHTHTHVQVTAFDSDESFNGEVILSLDDTSDFDIDPDSGEIFTLRVFDYETDSSFSLNVIATG